MKLPELYTQYAQAKDRGASTEELDALAAEQSRRLLLASTTQIESITNEILALRSSSTNFAEYQEYLRRFLAALTRSTIETGQWRSLELVIRTLKDTDFTGAMKLVLRRFQPKPDNASIIEIIRIFNLLEIFPYRIIPAFPAQEYAAAIASKDPLILTRESAVARFINLLKELQARKKLANVWSIDGETQIDDLAVEYQGSTQSMELQILKSDLRTIQAAQTLELLQAISGDATELGEDQIFDIAAACLDDILSIMITEKPYTNLPFSAWSSQPKKVILMPYSFETPEMEGEGDHAVAFGLWNGFLLYVNRGYTTRSTEEDGIRIFAISEDQERRFISFIEQRNLTMQQIEEYLFTNFRVANMYPMKKQLTGNCSLISVKSLYWFALYLNALKLMRDLGLRIQDQHAVAFRVAHAGYKFLSTYKRRTVVLEYMQLQTGFPQDRGLLTQVLAKIERQRGKKESLRALRSEFGEDLQQDAARLAADVQKDKDLASMPDISILMRAIDSANVAEVTRLVNLPYAVEKYDEQWVVHTPIDRAILSICNKAETSNYENSVQFQILRMILASGMTKRAEDIASFIDEKLQRRTISAQDKSTLKRVILREFEVPGPRYGRPSPT